MDYIQIGFYLGFAYLAILTLLTCRIFNKYKVFEKNSERYEWLRSHIPGEVCEDIIGTWPCTYYEFDYDLDSAMAKCKDGECASKTVMSFNAS